MGRCPSPTLLWSMPHFRLCWRPSTLQAHWGRWHHTCLLWPACLFTVHVGECSSPLSGGAFLMTATVASFPLFKVAGWVCHSCLLWQACLFTVPVRECPSPSLQSSGCPTLFATCLFFFSSASLLFVFFFGDQSVQGAILICPREYPMALICSLGGLSSRVGAGIW
jgi:hypothetical protein